MLLTVQSDSGLALLIIGILLVLYSPAIIMFIIGITLRKKNSKASKVLLILSGIYVLVGIGICGTM